MTGTSRFVLQSAVFALAVFFAGCAEDARVPTAPDPIRGVVADHGALVTAGELTGRHLYLFKGGVIPETFSAQVQRMGGQVAARYPEIGLVSVSGLDPRRNAILSARPEVEASAEDFIVQWIPRNESFDPSKMIELESARGLDPLTIQPSSDQSGAAFYPFFQWNMKVTNADDAWLTSNQGAGVLVCVLDTGIDPGQLDLIGKVDLGHSASFVPAEPFISDLHFHGTAVSSIVTSRGIGVASVAPDAQICAVKVLDQTGSGAFEWVLAGIIYASQTGAEVINMSLGAYIDDSFLTNLGVLQLVLALQAAVAFANLNDVLVVAASGNDGLNLDADPPTFLHLPSQIPGALSVGAHAPRHQQKFDRRPPYSNYGFTGVGIGAPGGDFVGDVRDLILMSCSSFVCPGINFYLFAAGTSFAAPHVAGAAAVLESDAFSWDMSPSHLGFCLKFNARPPGGRTGPTQFFGSGLLDVLAAVKSC